MNSFRCTQSFFKKSLLIAVIAISFLLSCRQEVGENPVTPGTNKKLDISPEAAQTLTCSGYDLSKIKEVGGYLVLEPDLIIEKAGFELDVLRNKKARKLQYAVNAVGVADYSRVTNINYFIDGSVQNIPIQGSGWVSAINQATTDWSSVAYVGVRFNAVSSAAQADLVFYSDAPANAGVLPACATDLGNGLFAVATVPSNGQVGRYVSINDNGPSTNAVGKNWVIRHEIGHTLGFRHADMYQRVITNDAEPVNSPNECGGAVMGGNLLLGTPNRDIQSVMVSAADGVTDINFNNNDIRAVQLLYPQQQFITQPIQINRADFNNTVLILGTDPYFIAFAQLEIRIVRPVNCGGYLGGTCYNTIATSRFTTNTLIGWSNVPVQNGDIVQVYGVNYKGDYVGASYGSRAINLN